MKKIYYSVIVFSSLVLIPIVSVYAYSSFTYVEPKNTAEINNQYFDQNGFKVVRFKDTVDGETNTCYVVHNTQSVKLVSSTLVPSLSISCIK